MNRSASLVCMITFSVLSPGSDAQWLQTSSEVNGLVGGVGTIDSSLFAGTMINLEKGGVFRSDDNGDHWVRIDSGLPNNVVSCLTTLGKNLFVVTDSGFVSRSTDKGASWTSVPLSATVKSVYLLLSCGLNLYAATNGDGVYFSQDSGSTWKQLSLAKQVITSIAVQDSVLVAATGGQGVFISTDAGVNWSPRTDQPDYYITAVGINQLGIFAGTLNGFIFQSTDLARNWRCIGGGWMNRNPDRSIYARVITFFNSKLIIGAVQGVFVGNIEDGTWSFTNTDCANVTCLVYREPYLFAGVSGGVWRRVLSEITTSAPSVPRILPDDFQLEQNYPNPFNPTTTISFSLPRKSYVSLKIFDVVGREAATLVAEELPAGKHTRQWNAEGISSGMYFYRMQATPAQGSGGQAGSSTIAKKLLLLK